VSAAVRDEGDSGVPHGSLLAHFAAAVCLRSPDIAELGDRLVTAVGPAGAVEAAATVAIFNGLVRVADATGIPLDDGTVALSDGWREGLGLHRYGGAANTDVSRVRVEVPSDVRSQFT